MQAYRHLKFNQAPFLSLVLVNNLLNSDEHRAAGHIISAGRGLLSSSYIMVSLIFQALSVKDRDSKPHCLAVWGVFYLPISLINRLKENCGVNLTLVEVNLVF